MDQMHTPQRDRFARIDSSEVALRMFHTVNRKAREIAKRNGMNANGEVLAHVTVSIMYGDGNMYHRFFHLKFSTESQMKEFTADFGHEARKVNLFERGVTVSVTKV